MYFQTQRDIWCHLITGTLPNASLLAEAYQSWIALGKYGQNLAKRKLEISWNSTKTNAKACSRRLFKNRCNYMIYSFEAWSALQDYQGACGVDSRSLSLSVIQEHEIIEMLGCFSELLKEVKLEMQNYISQQPFANDPRCRSAPDKMVYGRYGKSIKSETQEVDIAAAGDQRILYSGKNAAIKHKIEMLQEGNNTADQDCPQEFNVDNSGDESSGSTQSGSEESESENSDETENKSCESEVTANYEGMELIRGMANSLKRNNSQDSLITNDNSDGHPSSESESSSRTDDIPASFSNTEDILTKLEAVISGLSMGTFEGDSSDENREHRATDDDEHSGDSGSSEFEFIEREDYFTDDDFEHDLPPRPSTS